MVSKIQILFICLFLFPLACLAQKTYRVSRDSTHGIVPDNYLNHIDPNKLKDKITVFNGYTRDYKVLFSYDQQNWDTLKIPNLQFAIFKSKRLFAKIITSTTVSFITEMRKANLYQIIYDTAQKKWVIELRQTFD